MTVKDAAEKAQSNDYIDPNLIICLGYVDIMNGSSFNTVKLGFLDMMSAFYNRGIQPAICTLPLLLHKTENVEANQIIRQLNNFLLNQRHWKVVDLNRHFVRADKIVLSNYQP